MITIIHHNDPDGFLSAFWVSHFSDSGCRFISIDYNYKTFPKTEDEEVFIVDFSPRAEDMLSLLKSHKVHWIDHHVSSKGIYGDTKNILGFRNHKCFQIRNPLSE